MTVYLLVCVIFARIIIELHLHGNSNSHNPTSALHQMMALDLPRLSTTTKRKLLEVASRLFECAINLDQQ